MGVTNPYRYSYSGADAKVYVRLQMNPSGLHQLESIHTISVSVHEAKGQARALGHRGIKGLSRGVRTIAGSLILTVIEDHPLRQLMMQAADPRFSWYRGGWSMDQNMIGCGTAIDQFDFNNRLAELLPPIDILIAYVSEGGKFSTTQQTLSTGTSISSTLNYQGAAMMVRGVDFVDSGMITSVNDIVSEITLSFIAMDFNPIYLNDLNIATAIAKWDTQQSGGTLAEHEMLMKLLGNRYGSADALSAEQEFIQQYGPFELSHDLSDTFISEH